MLLKDQGISTDFRIRKVLMLLINVFQEQWYLSFGLIELTPKPL